MKPLLVGAIAIVLVALLALYGALQSSPPAPHQSLRPSAKGAPDPLACEALADLVRDSAAGVVGDAEYWTRMRAVYDLARDDTPIKMAVADVIRFAPYERQQRAATTRLHQLCFP